MPSEAPSTSSGAPSGPTGAVRAIGGTVTGHPPPVTRRRAAVDQCAGEPGVVGGIEERRHVEPVRTRGIEGVGDEGREIVAIACRTR